MASCGHWLNNHMQWTEPAVQAELLGRLATGAICARNASAGRGECIISFVLILLYLWIPEDTTCQKHGLVEAIFHATAEFAHLAAVGTTKIRHTLLRKAKPSSLSLKYCM
ncbi:hypothetical protein CEXT_172191 [Caerostris extrusa]|uniref:Uncharacterized protein n=1 Tax=Caerostris extrusa TaxID=172846 RepID=A0AAV4XAB0_CAEEX|nr:hypothetical protein CEXT_172191 [Caerostris extrusa]